MNWNYFIFFAIISLLFWVTGAWAGWKNRKTTALAATGCGLLVFFAFIVLMWISLERPPLRTMGETRLWYSFFLPLAGIIVYSRWRYKWILSFSTLLSAVFIGINLFKPEIHNKTLMPALQSPWFAPHVIVYMFAYALLGAAFVMAVYLLFSKKKYAEELDICDNLVYVAGHSSPSACSSVPVGQRSVGNLLVLGPQRDLGGSHMAGLSGVYPLSTPSPFGRRRGPVDSHRQLPAAANVLVGNQLPAFVTGHQRPYV